MTHVEFVRWVQFYERHPFDDVHRFQRPAAVVAASMGAKIDPTLEWLGRSLVQDYSDADARTLAAFGVNPPR